VGLPLNQVGPRILVIDDEPQIHRFLRPALRAAGYEVIQALTAADGLLIVKRQMPLVP
jgi:two-component system KDP operon response regulator KdpE